MSHGRTLVVIVAEPTGAVVRHRAMAFAPALARAGVTLEVHAWVKSWLARRRVLARAQEAGQALVLSRLLTVVDVERVRARVRRLLLDFDDALPFRDTQHGATPSGTRGDRFRAIVAAADAVSCGNPYLAGLAAAAGRRATVLPTVVDVPDGPPAPEPPVPPHVLGWIGSRATLPYVEAATVELAAVVAMGNPFRLRIIADATPTMPPGIPVEAIRWSLEGEAAAIDGMHVGVAPLPDDPWTRGKCGLKVLQMLARGRPVVVSAVGVQPEQVKDGLTGYVAPTREAFVEGVRRLLKDDALRRRLGAAGRDDVRARWSVAAWSSRVVEHVTGALT